MKTDFERQRTVFDEFIEDTRDRYDAIIRDGVQIIFGTSSFNFDNLVTVEYDPFQMVVTDRKSVV